MLARQERAARELHFSVRMLKLIRPCNYSMCGVNKRWIGGALFSLR